MNYWLMKSEPDEFSIDALTPQPWDVPLDFIATDRELIACTEPHP